MPHRSLPAWYEPAPGYETLAQDARADVCVIGLGGSGLAAVTELVALGRSVVAIDAGEIAGGAAGRNGGLLLAGAADFYHDAVVRQGHERARAFYRMTLAEIERMTRETPEHIRITGSLRLAHDAMERTDCERQLAVMREDGLPVEAYEGPEGSGILLPTDGVYHPVRRCRALARDAVTRGARLHEHTPALALEPGAVVTPHGRVHCGATIVAVDGALVHMLPELTDHVHPTRLQMLGTAPDADGNAASRSPRPVYSRWGLEYWQRLGDGRLLLGGFRDVAEAEEWTDVAEPSAAVQGALERFLRESLAVTTAVTHRWAAIVSYTDDRLPILEEIRPDVWAVGAYSGTGNVVGAMCGRASARLAIGERSDVAELLRAVPR